MIPSELIEQLFAYPGEEYAYTGGAMTRRQMVLKEYNLEDKPYSLEELSRITKIPLKILNEVAKRGYGAYNTNPSSVRLKGSFVKNVNAPMSRKLSPQQWAMARVYSFISGNPKHDNDLRANRGGAKQQPQLAFKRQLEDIGISPADYLKKARTAARRNGYDASALTFSDNKDHKLQMTTPDGSIVRFGRVGYNDFHLWSYLEKNKRSPKGLAKQKRDVFQKSHSNLKGNWEKNDYSPNWLALRVLW